MPTLAAQLAERGPGDVGRVDRGSAPAFAPGAFADAIGQSSSDLAVDGCAPRARRRQAAPPEDVDLIIVATSTPDMVFPSTATIVQRKLGACKAARPFDLQAVCSGFVYGLSVADSP